MNVPNNTIPIEWGVAFGEWLATGAKLDEQSMADWFEAAFEAAIATQAGNSGQPPFSMVKVNEPQVPVDKFGGGGGVWVSYYPDRSGVYAHGTEIDQLRAAVGGHREVKFLEFEKELLEK
jgi:hypothetical protein